MPRDPFLPLTAQEQRFVLHYIRQGATPEVAHIAERLARLKKGEGDQYLKRKHVQEEIHRRKIAVEFEQNRLIAKDQIGVLQAEQERDLVTLHKIEAALDKVIALEAKDHGHLVLKGIELGLVYVGAIRDGNKVKVQTVDPLGLDGKGAPPPTDEPKEDGFYRSIFAGMKTPTDTPAAAQTEPAPLMPADDKPKQLPTVQATPPAPKPTQKPQSKPKATQTLAVEIT